MECACCLGSFHSLFILSQIEIDMVLPEQGSMPVLLIASATCIMHVSHDVTHCETHMYTQCPIIMSGE